MNTPIFQLTTPDFLMIMDTMNLTNEQKDKLLAKAYEDFTIYDWADYVKDFLNMALNDLND